LLIYSLYRLQIEKKLSQAASSYLFSLGTFNLHSSSSSDGRRDDLHPSHSSPPLSFASIWLHSAFLRVGMTCVSCTAEGKK